MITGTGVNYDERAKIGYVPSAGSLAARFDAQQQKNLGPDWQKRTMQMQNAAGGSGSSFMLDPTVLAKMWR